MICNKVDINAWEILIKLRQNCSCACLGLQERSFVTLVAYPVTLLLGHIDTAIIQTSSQLTGLDNCSINVS